MTVLATFQQTPEGQAAVAAAIAEARLRGTDVVVLSAPAPAGGAAVHTLTDIDPALDAVGVTVQVRAAVRPDDLAGEVVDLATELAADLIVIGLRRRSPVSKVFFGSVAQDVLLNSSVPVLAVRSAG